MLFTSRIVTQARLAKIALFNGRSCLSLFQPPYRCHPENQQHPFRVCHPLKALETSPKQQNANGADKVLIKPFANLSQHHCHWTTGVLTVYSQRLTMEDLLHG